MPPLCLRLLPVREKYNGVARKGVEAIEMKLKGYEATEIAKHYDTSVNKRQRMDLACSQQAP